MEINETKRPVFLRIMLGGLIAGIVAAVINNIYFITYTSVTGNIIRGIISLGSITKISLVSSLLAALGYFILSRFTYKATRVFIIIVIVLTCLSCINPLVSSIFHGDWFPSLSIPMHIFEGLLVAYIIPRFLRN
jgi:hypothetical protein